MIKIWIKILDTITYLFIDYLLILLQECYFIPKFKMINYLLEIDFNYLLGIHSFIFFILTKGNNQYMNKLEALLLIKDQ